MKNGKMTYEEFESLLKDIKKSNRPEILDYIERVKCDTTPRHKEDLENDAFLINATDKILKSDEFVSDHVWSNGLASTAMTIVVGGLALSVAPFVSAFGGEDALWSYLKNLGALAGVSAGGSLGTSLFAYKFHQACYNHKLKKELKDHLKTKFSNQVQRDVDRVEVSEVDRAKPNLRVVDPGKDFIA